MRVALDARLLGEHLHGIGRYAWSLTDALAGHAPEDEFVLLGNDNAHTRQLCAAHPHVRLVEARSKPFSPLEHLELPRLLRQVAPDLFHALSTALPLPWSLPCPFVITVHDLIPLVFPGVGGWFHELYYRGYLRLALRQARVVMTDAQVGRQDLWEQLGHPLSRTTVVHCGVEPVFAPASQSGEQEQRAEQARLARELGLQFPYILVMGNPRPHKNLLTALEVFAQTEVFADLPEGLSDLQLVVVSSTSASLEEAVATHPLAHRIKRLSHVDEALLPLLYRHCHLFFCPSLCEGFGLPLAEALASGAVCVSSTATSLGEVLGDGGVGVDARPGRARELAHAMHPALCDETLRQQLRARAVAQAARFSWEVAAAQVHALYHKALGPPG